MTRQIINVGAAPNDGTGDSIRAAFSKADANFGELYSASPVGLPKAFPYAMDSVGGLGMCQAAQGTLAVGDVVQTTWYDTNKRDYSFGRYLVVAANGTQNTSTVGSFTAGGSLGAIIEGAWYRFAYQPVDGVTFPLRPLGVACVDGVTGWHSRFQQIVAFMKQQEANGAVLTGPGSLTCTETVILDRVKCSRMPVFKAQAGFFSVGQTNLAVTIAPGSPVVVTAAGHGLTAGKEIMFGTTGRVPGGLQVLTRYYVVNPTTDTFQVATSSGGSPVNSSTVGQGTHYAFFATDTNALPSKPSTATDDVLRWDGKIKRLGIVVRCGTNSGNEFWNKSEIEVWGDGDFSLTTKTFNVQPTTICVRHEADDSANAEYRYATQFGYIGCVVAGPAEKHKIRVHGIKCRWLAYVTNGASCDTMELELHGNDCQAWYGEHEGVGTSLKLKLAVESRADPARDSSSDSEGLDSPAFLIRNGKATTFAGFMRANNGMRNIVVKGKINSLGTTLRIGADFVSFDHFRIIHGYGIAIDIQSVLYVSGFCEIRNWRNPFANDSAEDVAAYAALNLPARPTPCVMLGRIGSAAALTIVGMGVENAEGLRVGYVNDSADPVFQGPQADGLTYSSVNANLGKHVFVMGTSFAHNADATFSTRSDKGINESLTGWRAAYMADCVLDVSGGKGNGKIDAGVTGTSRITIGNEFTTVGNPSSKKFSIAKATAAVCEVGIPTLQTTGVTINPV